jgi:hypothetical protein
MFDANKKAVNYLFCAQCQSEFDRVQTEDLTCRIWEQLLGMLRFRLRCMRLTRESMRTSLISQ